jgi:membrane associated rhomboid family serine protease
MRSLLVIFIFVRVTFIPAALLIAARFLIQFIDARAVAKVQTGGVAYLAHIAGLIFGAVTAGLFEGPRRRAEQRCIDHPQVAPRCRAGYPRAKEKTGLTRLSIIL